MVIRLQSVYILDQEKSLKIEHLAYLRFLLRWSLMEEKNRTTGIWLASRVQFGDLFFNTFLMRRQIPFDAAGPTGPYFFTFDWKKQRTGVLLRSLKAHWGIYLEMQTKKPIG